MRQNEIKEYAEFFVIKQSGTYAETLEAYGLASLIDEILSRVNATNRKVEILNNGPYYTIKPSQRISGDLLSKVDYFQIIKFLKKDMNQPLPEGTRSSYYDYPQQAKEFEQIRAARTLIVQDRKLKPEDKKQKLLALDKLYQSEFGKKIDESFDVLRQIQANINYPNYLAIHTSIHASRAWFKHILDEILNFYSSPGNEYDGASLIATFKQHHIKFKFEITPLQLYNPHQGKGNNKIKADGFDPSKSAIRSTWIHELMKVCGAMHMMICLNTGYDLKVLVPEFKHIIWRNAKELMHYFKRHIKTSTPIKLDILSVLNFSISFLQMNEKYTGSLKNTINGFHSVYQKDMGQNRAVTNISFLEIPDFVEISDEQSVNEWIHILSAQKDIINPIKEQGNAIQGLLAYRKFLSGGNLQNFFKFITWYCIYLMKALEKKQYYVKPFKIGTLNLFYMNMDSENLRLSEIIANKGFQAVAQAIRKSTVSLQYTPPEERQFNIRYGLAHEIQNKSKSKVELATFAGEFIATYNAETAKVVEKGKGKWLRSNIKDEELAQFFTLIDKYPPRLIGALLASYGFALRAKEVTEDEEPALDKEVE